MASTESASTDPSPDPAETKRQRILQWLPVIVGIATAVCVRWWLRLPASRKRTRGTKSPQDGTARAPRRELAESSTTGPRGLSKKRSSRVRPWLFGIVALGFSYWLLRLVVIGVPQTYEDDKMHFKYGSIGSDNLRRGIPYEIWRILPDMFPHYLLKKDLSSDASHAAMQQRDVCTQRDSDLKTPQNYEAFGLVTDKQDGQDRPIGFSKRWHLGVGNVVGLNCAFCHVSTVRKVAGGPQEIILGMPANTVDAERFFRFLFRVADDPEFTVENVMRCIGRKRQQLHERGLGYWKEFIQRRIVVPLFIRGLKNLKHTFSFLDRVHTPFGPGRVDTWAAYKVLRLQEPAWFMEYLPEWFGPYIDMDSGPVTGLADFPALWQEKVAGGALHWDGNTRIPEERNITAALGAGVTPATLDLDSLRKIGRWMESDLKPLAYRNIAPEYLHVNNLAPKYLPVKYDHARGEIIFKNLCKKCHANDGERIRSIEAIDLCISSKDRAKEPDCEKNRGDAGGRSDEYIGTDPERLRAFTEELSDKLNEVRHLSVWKLENYWKTQGYANMLLTGIWLRAPYLHNGSVPTLWHLLEKPENRPSVFCRGNDLYDWTLVGFEWKEQGTDRCQPFHYYDTRLPGNGNGGHLYGTDLSGPDKKALIEYLKTL